MNRWHMLTCLAAVSLGACTTTIDIRGMLGEREALTGSVTRYGDGGTIEIYGEGSTHCVGSFRYRSNGGMPVGGTGSMICDDRRAGPFSFTLHGARHGAGTGELDSVIYRFSF